MHLFLIRYFLGLILVLGCSLLSSCALFPARAVQTESFLAKPNELPSIKKIETVAFINQSVGHCGPATLTMAMQWAGVNVAIEDIATQVYTPGFKGSLQSDMISAARRNGLLAIPINNLEALLTEVAAGHPVIIFENLALSWLPQWHYALVLGYDLQKQTVTMHSGPTPYFTWDMSTFERSWMLGDYWGLVVLPAGTLAASAGELAHVTAAVGLENIKKNIEAENSYRKILQKWPDSLVGLIGLANLVYQNGARSEAIHLLQQAIRHHPNSVAAKHNLAVALAK